MEEPEADGENGEPVRLRDDAEARAADLLAEKPPLDIDPGKAFELKPYHADTKSEWGK